VAEDHHQRGVQMLDRILDARDHMVVEKVAGIADHEDVAQSLVEQDLGATRESAQVRTTAKGCCPETSSLRRATVSSGWAAAAANKTFVALAQPRQRHVGA
jgi:hypothetical protein